MFVRCIVQFVFADYERLCRTWQYQRLMLHCAGRLTFTDIRSLGCFNCSLMLSILPETFVPFSRKMVMSLGYVVACIGIYTSVSQLKTLNVFYLVIYWTQKVYNYFIFPCSIVLPPVGHSSNHEHHCWNSQDNRSGVRIFIALSGFSFDSLSYLPAFRKIFCLFLQYSFGDWDNAFLWNSGTNLPEYTAPCTRWRFSS